MADSVEKWQHGDEDAFEAIFYQYQNMVRKTAIGILNDSDHAEDVVQDVFFSAWKSRYSFDPQKGKLSTWLYRITVNRCIKYRKKNGKEAASLDDASSRGFQPVADLQQPDAESLIEYERMMTAIRALNGTHRPVIVLRYLNDLRYSEIAQVLDIPLGTVKSRLNEAVKALRRELNGRGCIEL